MNIFAILMFMLVIFMNWMLIYSKTSFNPKDNRKYINIKNRSLAKLLIQQKSEYVKYNKVSDRIKLNIPCFVSYIVLILIVIISIILFSCPEMPCEPVRLPFSRHGGITIDTYNMKVPYILAFLMLFVQFDITFISLLIKLFKANNETETKGSKIGWIILTLGFLFVTGYLIYALFQ